MTKITMSSGMPIPSRIGTPLGCTNLLRPGAGSCQSSADKGISGPRDDRVRPGPLSTSAVVRIANLLPLKIYASRVNLVELISRTR